MRRLTKSQQRIKLTNQGNNHKSKPNNRQIIKPKCFFNEHQMREINLNQFYDFYIYLQRYIYIIYKSLMDPHDKTVQHHKQIRRDYIHKLFAKRRTQRQINTVDSIENQDLRKAIREIQARSLPTLKFEDLVALRNISLKKQGIAQLHGSKIIQNLPKYLSSQYLNQNEQYEATWIICNLFYIPGYELPSKQFIGLLLDTLVNANAKIKQNCLLTLSHLLHDHTQEIRTLLIKEFDFIDIIWGIFNGGPQTKIIGQLLKIFYYLLVKNKQKNEKFRKLSKFLFMIIGNFNDQATIILAFYCLFQLSKMLNEQCAVDIYKSGVISKLIKLSEDIKTSVFNKTLIGFISLNLRSFSKDDCISILFPYLSKTIREFQTVKAQGYRLLFDILQQTQSTSSFITSPLFTQTYEDIYNSTDKSVIKQTIYIICVTLLNENNLTRNQVVGLIGRIRALQLQFQRDDKFVEFVNGFYNSYGC